METFSYLALAADVFKMTYAAELRGPVLGIAVACNSSDSSQPVCRAMIGLTEKEGKKGTLALIADNWLLCTWKK